MKSPNESPGKLKNLTGAGEIGTMELKGKAGKFLSRVLSKHIPAWAGAGPSILDLEDDYDVMARQYYSIAIESGIPSSRHVSRSMLHNWMDVDDNEALPETEGETPYSKKWKRVSDEVFAQYAPIEQRRPA